MESQAVFQAKTQAKIISIESPPWSVVAIGVVGADIGIDSWRERVLGCACDCGHRDQETHHKVLLKENKKRSSNNSGYYK